MVASKYLNPFPFLEDKEQDYLVKNIFDNLKQALVIIDRKLVIHFCNEVAHDYALRAFDRSISSGDSLRDFVPKTTIDSFNRTLETIVAGEKVSIIKDLKNPAGDQIWFEISIIPVIEEKSEVNFIIIHGIDITQLKTSESKIRETERRYEDIVQSQSEMICRFTIDGTITFVNNAYCTFFDTLENEIIGLNFYYRVPDFLREKVKSDIMALTPGSPQNSYIERLIGKGGSIRWISGTNTAIFDNDGNFVEIQTVAKDITELKNVEEDLIQAKERVEETDRLKSIFLSNISHEIRTPLNGILGFSSLLMSTQLNKETIENYCTLIEKSGKQLLEIIDDMLEVSMIETRQLKLHYTNVYLPNILDNINEFINQSLNPKDEGNIEVKKCIPLSGSKFFNIDGIRLYQIYFKLLNNAFKFTRKGCIEYGYFQPEVNIVRFFVRDTGIGIPKDKQDIIFEQFRQADESSIRNYGGNGLGLTIVKAIVESMGSKIQVESRPGKGSNFYFDLPIKEPEKEELIPPQVEEVLEKEYDWKDIKILIVEDIYINYIVLKAFLRNTKAVVIPADSGNEALNAIKNHPDINLVLLDIRLPDINGYEIARRIKEINSNISIIAQTAYALDSDQLEAHKSGCDSVLIKPIEKEILLRTINDFLKK